MADVSNFFDVSRGFQIDSTVSVIYTPTAAPDTADCGTASVGSLCMSKETGSVWKKVTDQGGIGDWLELANSEYAIKVEHVFSTGLILDQVDTTVADQFAWMITAFDEVTQSNRWSALITLSHDGTTTGVPTNVKYSLSSILTFGSKIKNLDVRGILTLGDDSKNYMSLHVAAGVPTTFTSYRMVKNLASSRAVVLGGANLDNHISNGSVHLQPYQNELLDAIPSNSAGIVTLENFNVISSAITTALTSEISDRQTEKGVPNGVATLNASGKVPDFQLNTYNITQIDSKIAIASTSLYHNTPYDIASAVINKPSGSAKVLRFTAVRLFTIPENLVGSWFVAGIPSIGTAIFAVFKNTSQIGTITFTSGSTHATMSVSETTFQLGDVLGINAPPVQDSKLADISFTIAASL